MKKVLFYDTVCPLPYDELTLYSRPQGGTESTVTRVAKELAKTNIVVVAQHNRFTRHVSNDNVIFTRIEPKLFKERFDTIIILRDTTPIRVLRPHYQDANIYLWCHDLAGDWISRDAKEIKANDVEVVAVSEFHKTNLIETIKAFTKDESEVPKIHVVYNPIDSNIVYKDTPIDNNKLVFLSSPHKGLDYTYYLFERALTVNPNFKLFVFNPNYIQSNLTKTHHNFIQMKPVPSIDAVSFSRDALCCFYPNKVFPETFGLVFAECNAVGVPVLTHKHGAANEVLGGPPQVIDCNNMIKVLDTLMDWYDDNRPVVRINPKFELSSVIPEWVRLISR